MVARHTDRIRLMSDADAAAACRWTARHANLVTLLSAALLADDDHVVRSEAMPADYDQRRPPIVRPHLSPADAVVLAEDVGRQPKLA